jgi:hypothetical protein
MALTDATAFQLCIANAAMFMAQRRQPEIFQYDKCTEALEYYGKTLSQVTKRLENSSDCTSTGIITTVLGFICHDVSFVFHLRSALTKQYSFISFMLEHGIVGQHI